MNKIRKHITFKLISIILIIAFLNLDIARAYPSISSKLDNLAVQSPWQINMMGEHGAEFQKSVFSRRDVFTTVMTTAKYMLDEGREQRTVAGVLGAQLHKAGIPVTEGIAGGRIDLRYIKWKDEKKKEVILIPFSREGYVNTDGENTHIIQISHNKSMPKNELIGYDYEIDAVDGKSRYVAKVAERVRVVNLKTSEKSKNVIKTIDEGLDTDANELLKSFKTEELPEVFETLEKYAKRKDVHAFKRFRAYMILFGSHYVDSRGVRFINVNCEPNINKALVYKKEAYRIYAKEAERLLNVTLEKEGFKFAIGMSDYKLCVPEGVAGVSVRSGVRIDMSSGFGGDHVLLAMDLGSRAVNASVLLKDRNTGKYDYPITVDVKKVDEPVIKLRSLDMGKGAKQFVEIRTMKELFDFEKDGDVMLAKAAIVASGIVPMGFREGGFKLSDVLNKFGGGFEMVTDVKDIPSGSGLGTSSALASTIVSALVKFSGQSTVDEHMTDKEKMLVVARTVLVEEILGSLGGYADSCNIFPAVKFVTTEPGVFLPKYQAIELSGKAERELYDTLVLTDGSYRQFSGDAAWQFAGLWVMRPKNVFEARMNTMRIGAEQSELMTDGNIREFGRLEGADYVNRTNICPAGNNEYVRRVNALLVEEFGKDAFWFDVTGARGGAGGCYWMNRELLDAKAFKKAFLRVSRQAIKELEGKINFEGEPRIYDYKLNKKGIEIKLIRFDLEEKKAYQKEKEAKAMSVPVSVVPEGSLKVAFFDWDGTITDTAEQTREVFIDFYVEMVGGTKDEAATLWFTLDGKTQGEQYDVLTSLAEKAGRRISMSEDEYKENFTEKKIRKSGGMSKDAIPLVSSAVNFLRYLKKQGIRVYIVSGFRIDKLREQVKVLGLNDVVDGICGSAHTSEEKISLSATKAEYINKILRETGVNYDNAMMVGDTAHDIRSGIEAGVFAVGRAGTDAKYEELRDAGAEITLKNFDDMKKVQQAIEEKLTGRADGVTRIDLRNFDDNDSNQILKWRKELALDARYESIQRRLMYNVPKEPMGIGADGTEIYIPDKGIRSKDVVIHKRELSGAFNGLDARVIYLENRPRETGKRMRLCKFRYGDLEYSCGPRLSPYSFGHIVAGSDMFPQKLDNDGEGLKFFLILSRIFGEGYEGFFNAIAPTSATFHAQYVSRRTTIWDAEDISKWPMKAELVEGEDINDVVKRALKVFNRYDSGTEYLEATCDVLMTFQESETEPGKGKYKIILLPRLKGNEERRDKGFLTPHSKPYSDSSLFGTFGGLEVGGCFMAADRTLEAFELLLADNGALYKRGMEEISWTGSGTRKRFTEHIDQKVAESVRVGTLSEYRVEDPSPEEALRYLLLFLGKVSDNKLKFSGYLSRLPKMRQDEFEKVADECLVNTREIFDQLSRDQFHMMTQFYPEVVYNAYSRLFRYCREDIEDVTTMLGDWDNIVSSNNYVNKSVFADGEGGYFIDDYGMPGKWEIELRTEESIPNRFVLRTVDALYKALHEKVFYSSLNLRIVLTDDMPKSLSLGNENSLAGFSIEENKVYVLARVCHKGRAEQEKIFSDLLKSLPVEKLAVDEIKVAPAVPHLLDEEKPTFLAATVSMVETGRARDYLHRKFNYRVQAAVQGLCEEGKEALFSPIETLADRETFIEEYRRKKQDIIMLSLYQLKRAEIDMIHELVLAIKAINPDVFVVVEGPFTIHAKQALALCPEIDMMVRGEADRVVSLLMDTKPKDTALTVEMARYVLNETEGGVFIRAGEMCFISDFDKTVINSNIRLLSPEREMEAIWYPEHGCPHRCSFCRKDTGGMQHKRIVSADERIKWMVERLMLEVDAHCGLTFAELSDVLKQQGGDASMYIGDGEKVQLLPDTFIGREKVEIVVVSENAVVNRKVMMEFCERIVGLGLQKYFRIKIADASIPTLIKEGEPDREYIKSLKAAGVYFIGFGSEHLSRTILAGLRKGWTEDRPEGYTANEIIAVNRVLLEEGFDPSCIRNNMLLNTPDSTLGDIKSGMLLMYMAPIYNSIYSYFSNGWGNARNSRIYVMEGTLWTAADTVRYASKYKFKDRLDSPEYADKDYLFTDHFYVAKATPEYSLRAEDAPLNYADERIHSLSGGFAYPHFYRYRVSAFLNENFHKTDILRAMDSWRDEKQGSEVNALAWIFDVYRSSFSEEDSLYVLKMLKAHMVALGELSFSGYKQLLEENGYLPETLELCGVSGLVFEGDNLMEPRRFNPGNAMFHFIKAHMMGMVAKEANTILSEKDSTISRRKVLLKITEAISYAYENLVDEGSLTVDVFSGGLFSEHPEFLKQINEFIREAVRENREIEKAGYLTRMSYPDQQIFEYLKHAYVTKGDEEIYDMIVRKMNLENIEFQTAIKKLVCERMDTMGKGFSAGDYREYVKSIKEYENMSVFGRNGALSRIASPDTYTAFSAIRELVEVVSVEENEHVLRSIALNLRDVAALHASAGGVAFVVSPGTLGKLYDVLGVKNGGEILFGDEGSSLVLMSDEINNWDRVIVARNLFPDGLKDSKSVESQIAKGDWIAFRFDGNNLVLFGSDKSDNDEFLKVYSEKMKFGNNTAMLERYLIRMSEISGRHVSFLKRQIEEGFLQFGDRLYTRHVMLMEERFLYVLPLIRMMVLDPELRMIFLGRGVAPFYNTLRMFSEKLGFGHVMDNSIYTGMYRHADHSDPRNHFMAQSIIPMLTKEEADEVVSDELWHEIIEKAKSVGIYDQLDKRLQEIWGKENGLSKLVAKKLKRREAIVFLANFGLDKRFIEHCVKVRESHLADAFINGGFAVSDKYQVDRLVEDMLGTDRAQKYLSEENRQFIIAGLKKLAGNEGNVLATQRELIHGYARVFGYGKEVGALKGNIEHEVRPLLNILLEGTEIYHRLEKASSVVCVDEASVSGISLLLTEAVVRCFNGDIDMGYKAHNMAQRTRDTDEYFKATGVLDSTSTSGIWPQEDTNEEFLGMYVDDEVREKKFLTFQELSIEFMIRQLAITPEKSDEQLQNDIVTLNGMIDEHISEQNLFGCIDDMKSLRYNTAFIKREFFKLVARIDRKDIRSKEAAIMEAVFINDFARGITVFEADSPVMFAFKDAIRDYRDGGKKQLRVPEDIMSLDMKIWSADMCGHFDRYGDRAKEMVLEYVGIASWFGEEDMGGKSARMFIDGTNDFNVVKKHFYNSCRPDNGRISYDSKKVYTGEDGEALYAVYYVSEKPVYLEAFSAIGLQMAMSNEDGDMKQVGEDAKSRLEKEVDLLNDFIRSNLTSHEKNILELVRIADEVLKEKKILLIDKEYVDPVFKKFNVTPSFTVDTRKERSLNKVPKPLSVEIPSVYPGIADELERNGLLNIPKKTLHLAYVKTGDSTEDRRMFNLGDPRARMQIENGIIFDMIEKLEIDGPVSLHLGCAIKDFEAIYQNGPENQGHLLMDEEEAFEIIVENVKLIKKKMGERGLKNKILLENGGYFPGNNYVLRHDFIRRVAAETGCGFLIDLGHIVYVALRGDQNIAGEDAEMPINYLKKIIDRETVKLLGEVHISVPLFDTNTGQWEHSGVKGRPWVSFHEDDEGVRMVKELLEYILDLREDAGIVKTHPLIVNFETNDDLAREEVLALSAMLNEVLTYTEMKKLPVELKIPERKFFERMGKKWDWKKGDGVALLIGMPFDEDARQGLEEVLKELREIEQDPQKLYLQEPEHLHITVAELMPNTESVSQDPVEKGKRVEKVRKARLAAMKHGLLATRFYYKDLTLTREGDIIALGYANNSNLSVLRDKLDREGVSSKRTNIVHMTIGRIFDEDISSEQLDLYKRKFVELRERQDEKGEPALLCSMDVDEIKFWDQAGETNDLRYGGHFVPINLDQGRLIFPLYKSEFARNHAKRVERIARLLARDLGVSKQIENELSIACAVHDLDTPGKTEHISPEAGERVREKFKKMGISFPEDSQGQRNIVEYNRFVKMFDEGGNEFTSEDRDFVLDLFEPCAALKAAEFNGVQLSDEVKTAVLFHHDVGALEHHLEGTGWSPNKKEATIRIASLLVAADTMEKGMNLFKGIFLNPKGDFKSETPDETRGWVKKSRIPEGELKKIISVFDEVAGSEEFKEIAKDAGKTSKKERQDLEKLGRTKMLSDIRDGNNAEEGVDDKPADKVTELFDIVESEMNNRRDILVKKANDIVLFLKERSEMATDMNFTLLKRDTVTPALIKQLRAVANEGRKYTDERKIIAAAKHIEGNLDLMEIDSIVISIIVRAREAARFGRTVTIALDFGWIPGYAEHKSIRDAVNPVVGRLFLLQAALESMDLENVKVVIREWNNDKEQHESVENWAKTVTDSLSVDKNFSDVMVFGGMDTVRHFENKWKTENIGLKERAFLAGVNSFDLKMETLSAGDYWDIEIMGMLSAAFEAFSGKQEVFALPIVDKEYSDIRLRRLVFKLPKADPKNMGEIIEKIKAKRRALVSV